MSAKQKEKRKKLADNEESQNIVNQKILDAILDDNEEEFTKIILQKTLGNSSFNSTFTLQNYKLPEILCGNTPISSLCAFFGSEKCFNSFLLLIPNESSKSPIKHIDNKRRTVLHFACAGGNLNIIRKVEQMNKNIDEKDANDLTPSCYASMFGRLHVIKYLWTKGAKIISPSSTDITPFHIACQYGYLEIVKFLYDTFLSDDSQNAKSIFRPNIKRNTTPLHLACEGGQSDVVRYLSSMKELFQLQANAYDKKLRTPVVIACQNGSLNCLKILSQNSDVIFDVRKKIFLPLVEASFYGYFDIVNFLLKREDIKKGINKTNANFLNAIQAAVMNRHPEIVNLLINNGAVRDYDSSQIGELMTSAFNSFDLETVKVLDKKCHVPFNEPFKIIREPTFSEKEKTMTWGDCYMQIACLNEKEELVTFLLTKKCNFDFVDFSTNVKHDWSHFLTFLIDKGVDLSYNPIDKKPLIIYSIATGNLKRVKKMLKMGVVLNNEIISDYNCVYEACRLKKLDLFNFLMSYKPIVCNANECIDLCISKTFDALKKSDNKTVEMYYFIIEKLLETQNVDVNKVDCRVNRLSLLSHAASICCIEILKLFERYNADFVNCILDIRKMNDDDYFPVLLFFKDHGCRFVHDQPILDLLLKDCQYYLNSRILVLLLDFISNDEIISFYNYCGNITDVAIRNGMTDDLLLIFKKVEKVIWPKNYKKEVFIDWVSNCNSPELKEFVCKSINT